MTLFDLLPELSGSNGSGGSAPAVFEKKAGEPLLETGKKGRFMYVVRSGSVRIEVGDHVVEHIQAGGFFGEMALIDDGPGLRTAKAVAETDCAITALDRGRFLQLVRNNPDFSLLVMETMARRLRRLTDIVTDRKDSVEQ